MQLVIAEKPSVARSIAKVLGATNSDKGYIEGNGYIVTWCVGHLVGPANPEAYDKKFAEKWSFETLPIIPQSWKFVINEKTSAQYNIIKKLMNDSRVDELVCATDAGREGECIFRYVYNKIGCKKQFKRLWISSMEDSAIREGFNNLKNGHDYDRMFDAGLCRAKSDWLVGMNATRLFTCRYGILLSIGRVQTPTLAMIVKRDYDVANFIKQKYFTVELDCGEFKVASERIDDESQAKSISNTCDGKNANVTDVKKEIKTVNPPKLYDLTTLQREANRQYGYTAQQTLDYTQSLYEAKLVTYPRTDSQFLTEDMEQTALEMVGVICNNIACCDGVSIANPNVKRCINNKKVSDHHAIIPTSQIANKDISELPEGEKNILFLIATKLILAVAEPHKYEAVKVSVNCENNTFAANGKTILDDGWKTLESVIKARLKGGSTEEKKGDEKALPEISQGQIFENVSSEIAEHWTSPPKPYTEDTLLKAMETAGNGEYSDDEDVEKKGLGTPATRASIIENLVKREFVDRKKKQIVATEKGANLIKVVPDEVKSAKLTADWETFLQKIERGAASATDFMNGINDFINSLMVNYKSKVEGTQFQQKRESIGKCPKCSAEIQKGKFGFYCLGKCGMNIAKVYGKELTETQLSNLLEGKEVSYTSNGKKTTVIASVCKNEYKGKTYYQWETKKK